MRGEGAGEGNTGPNTTENSDRQIRDNRMRCREEGVQGAAPQDTLQALGRILTFLHQIQQHSWGTPLRASWRMLLPFSEELV